MKLIKVILSSISQVVLINNLYTGLFILIGLFAVNWKVAISAIIASVMTWILAPHMNYTKDEIESGLAGFNPVLTAIALTFFWIAIGRYINHIRIHYFNVTDWSSGKRSIETT